MSTPRLRVVGWSTGTVGRHVIAGIEAHRDLELVGLWVSNPEKDDRDAGELAGLGRELGVRATTDRDALLAPEPDAIVHTAMTDDRMSEAIADLTAFVAAGVNVVSRGPVILQYPPGPGLRDRRLLDLLPAGGDGRPVRLRQAARLRRHVLAARHPVDGLGARRTPDRGGTRP